MKKIFMFAAAAAMTLSFASCQKESADKNGKEEQGFKLEYRIKTLNNEYTFSYNADGTVASIVSEWDNRVFTYEGKNFTITNGGTREYWGTLNDQGFVATMENAEHNWENTYDKNGFLTSSKQDGTETTKQSIEDGNILWWGRWDSDNSFWRRKEATYFEKANIGGVQTHWAEDVKGSKRWMWEARMFGNTSQQVLETCVWVNFGDEKAAKTAVYEYEYDDNGCITKEIKYYGPWNGTDLTGLDIDTETTFTWEKID